MSDNGNESSRPLMAVGNGRGAGGKFAAGNKLATGNPNNRRAQKLRNAYLRAVTVADLKAIALKVVEAAKNGDITAAREVCDRVLGKPVQMDLLERIEALEAAAQTKPQHPEKRWN